MLAPSHAFVSIDGDPPPGASEREAWARDVLLVAWPRIHGDRPVRLAEAQAIQAVGRQEGFYGLATRPAAWQGSNNWGAVQAGHGPPCGPSAFETVDSHADGTEYRWCYRRYPTAEDGAADLIRLLTVRRPEVWEVLPSGDADAIADAMRRTGYHETPVDLYARRMADGAAKIAAALGEPLAVRRAADVPPSPVDPGEPVDATSGPSELAAPILLAALVATVSLRRIHR